MPEHLPSPPCGNSRDEGSTTSLRLCTDAPAERRRHEPCASDVGLAGTERLEVSSWCPFQRFVQIAANLAITSFARSIVFASDIWSFAKLNVGL